MATIFNMFLACFGVLAVGLFVFELTRFALARQQLETVVQVAALTCETSLASSGNATLSSNQSTAAEVALKLFRANSILGDKLASSQLVFTSPNLKPSAGQAFLSFQFLDPIYHQP